jgi:hypothetical protein
VEDCLPAEVDPREAAPTEKHAFGCSHSRAFLRESSASPSTEAKRPGEQIVVYYEYIGWFMDGEREREREREREIER